MKSLFTILSLAIASFVYSQVQQVNFGNNTPLNRSEWYVPNSPTNTVGNRYIAGWIKAYEMFYMRQDSVRFKALSGFGNRFVYADDLGTLYSIPITDFYLSSNPAGYISSYTETDPIWNSVSSQYRTKLQNDALYQPLGSYVTTEFDPTVSSWAKAPEKPNYTASEVGAYPAVGNPSNFLTSVPSQTWLSITGKPTTLSGYGITDAYPLVGNPSGFLTTVTSGQITTALGYTPVNPNGSPTQYIAGDGTKVTFPTIPSIPSRVFINSVSRSTNSNYTISSTRDASVSYSVTLSVTNPLLAGSSTATAFLEYSTNAGSSWVTVSQTGNSSAVGIAVAIAITNTQTTLLTGIIPTNALVRIRTVTAGTASVTYITGQEILI